MITEILITTAGLIAVLIASFYIGHFSIWLIGRKNLTDSLTNTFLSILTGTILIILMYSALIVGLKTVMILFIVIISSIIIYLNPRFDDKERYRLTSRTTILWIVLAGLLGNSLTYIVEWSLASAGDADSLYYAKVSHWLSITKIENSFHHYNVVEPQFRGATPYHYFELWLTNFISQLFPQFTSFTIFKYITCGFFKSAFIIGLTAVGLETAVVKTKVAFIMLLSFLLCFVSLEFISSYHPIIYGFNASVFGRPNYLVFFFGLIGFVLLCLKKERVLAILILSILPVMSITAYPSVFLTYFVATLYHFFTKQIHRKRDLTILILNGLLTFIGILVFYKVLKPEYQVVALSISDLIEQASSIWKAIVGELIFISLSIGVAFITLGVLSFKHELLKGFRLPSLVLLGLFFFGVLSFQGLTELDNSYQFQYISFALFYVLVLSFLITYGLSSATGKLLVSLICIFFLSARILNQDHYKMLLSSNNYQDYHLKSRGYDQLEINEIKKNLGSMKVGVFYANADVLIKVPPRLRTFSYLPKPNIFGYLDSDIRIYPIVPESALYGSPIDTTKYRKAWEFNSTLKFYRDSLSFEEYMNFVEAEFIVSVDSLQNKHKPMFQIIPVEEFNRTNFQVDH